MPIPQRPLPSRRPGHAVPHKPRSTLTPTSSNSLDWRAEVAFLDSYASSRKAQSVPSAGVAIMDAATRARERVVSAAAETGMSSGKGREVGLEELIHDGKTKREKRSTTAASLGFDFIHTPSVLVLPDTTSPTRPTRSITPRAGYSLSTPSPLATTPQTPGLLSSSSAAAINIPLSSSVSSSTRRPRVSDAAMDDDSDLDEWEHVESGDAEDDLVLGELELEDRDEFDDGAGMVDKKEAVGMRRVDGLSYAAVLGPR